MGSKRHLTTENGKNQILQLDSWFMQYEQIKKELILNQHRN